MTVAANFENIVLCDSSESIVHCSNEYCEFVPAQLSVFLVGTPVRWCDHLVERSEAVKAQAGEGLGCPKGVPSSLQS